MLWSQWRVVERRAFEQEGAALPAVAGAAASWWGTRPPTQPPHQTTPSSTLPHRVATTTAAASRRLHQLQHHGGAALRRRLPIMLPPGALTSLVSHHCRAGHTTPALMSSHQHHYITITQIQPDVTSLVVPYDVLKELSYKTYRPASENIVINMQ